MRCTNPLVGVKMPMIKKDGTPGYYIDHGKDVSISVDELTGEISFFNQKLGIFHNDIDSERIVVHRCGSCPGCRESISKEWAIRITDESSLYDDEKKWFITLTYEDSNLIYNEYLDYKPDRATVSRDDCQNFMKRLRFYFSEKYNFDGIRFYLAAEYGEETNRPHYHLEVFNLPLLDLKYIGKSDCGFPLYNSQTLNNIWKKGHVVIGEFNFLNAAYCARYCLKKVVGKEANDYYLSKGIDPEFQLMSRRPGIGTLFYENNRDYLRRFDSHVLSGGKVVKHPSFYLNKLKNDFPDDEEILKKQRRYQSLLSNLERETHHAGMDYHDILQQDKRMNDLKLSKLYRKFSKSLDFH